MTAPAPGRRPVHEVSVHAAPLDPFVALIGERLYERLGQVLERTAGVLEGRAVINVNSTAAGGGVSEMLHRVLSYSRGAGIDARWFVIDGDEPFFRTTKALHHLLHGRPPLHGSLAPEARPHYEAVSRANGEALAELIEPGDLVVLHDPQVAGLAPSLAAAGALVIWQCHIGADGENHHTDTAWDFLTPDLHHVDAFVFSRAAYVPRRLSGRRVRIIPPSIDPFSAKNQQMPAAVVGAVLARAGVVEVDADGAEPTFARHDGSVGRVDRPADVVGGAVPAAAPVVLQVSRWDVLKDMRGVMEGFGAVDHASHDAHLVLAGPDVVGVVDDPEGREVLDDCLALWRSLPAAVQRRVHLALLPMEDLEENAAIVNALQRHAHVVVQKSLAEGFGLTVTEALWKARAVLASAVGGIVDQIDHRRHGLLVDPHDLAALARSINTLLADPGLAEELGRAGRARAVHDFLDSRQLQDHAALLAELAGIRHHQRVQRA